VPAEDVELIKADIEAVKKAKDDDAVGVEELKEKIEALKKSSMKIGARRARRACDAARSGWWLVAGGWWLVAGGWWLVAGGWWCVHPPPRSLCTACTAGEAMYKNAGDGGGGESAQYEDVKKDDEKKEEEKKDEKK
jgi:hypothetical protein